MAALPPTHPKTFFNMRAGSWSCPYHAGQRPCTTLAGFRTHLKDAHDQSIDDFVARGGVRPAVEWRCLVVNPTTGQCGRQGGTDFHQRQHGDVHGISVGAATPHEPMSPQDLRTWLRANYAAVPVAAAGAQPVVPGVWTDNAGVAVAPPLPALAPPAPAPASAPAPAPAQLPPVAPIAPAVTMPLPPPAQPPAAPAATQLSPAPHHQQPQGHARTVALLSTTAAPTPPHQVAWVGPSLPYYAAGPQTSEDGSVYPLPPESEEE